MSQKITVYLTNGDTPIKHEHRVNNAQDDTEVVEGAIFITTASRTIMYPLSSVMWVETPTS